MPNPVDELRTLPELRESHAFCVRELRRYEDGVEMFTTRVAELEQAIKEKEDAK